MSEQNLGELINRLKEEVACLPDNDVDARSRLDGIITELQAQFGDEETPNSPTLTTNIQDTIHQLEARHPDATTVLNNIMMTLANMGI